MTIALSTVRPWTLCTVTAYASCTGNCDRKIEYEAPLISIFCFVLGTGYLLFGKPTLHTKIQLGVCQAPHT